MKRTLCFAVMMLAVGGWARWGLAINMEIAHTGAALIIEAQDGQGDPGVCVDHYSSPVHARCATLSGTGGPFHTNVLRYSFYVAQPGSYDLLARVHSWGEPGASLEARIVHGNGQSVSALSRIQVDQASWHLLHLGQFELSAGQAELWIERRGSKNPAADEVLDIDYFLLVQSAFCNKQRVEAESALGGGWVADSWWDQNCAGQSNHLGAMSQAGDGEDTMTLSFAVAQAGAYDIYLAYGVHNTNDRGILQVKINDQPARQLYGGEREIGSCGNEKVLLGRYLLAQGTNTVTLTNKLGPGPAGYQNVDYLELIPANNFFRLEPEYGMGSWNAGYSAEVDAQVISRGSPGTATLSFSVPEKRRYVLLAEVHTWSANDVRLEVQLQQGAAVQGGAVTVLRVYPDFHPEWTDGHYEFPSVWPWEIQSNLRSQWVLVGLGDYVLEAGQQSLTISYLDGVPANDWIDIDTILLLPYTTELTDIGEDDYCDAPTAITLSNSTVAASSPVGEVVGTLSAVDLDEWEVHTFSLETTGTPFVIGGDQLRVAAPLDQDTVHTYQLVIRVQDSCRLSLTQTLTVTESGWPGLPDDTMVLDDSGQAAAYDSRTNDASTAGASTSDGGCSCSAASTGAGSGGAVLPSLLLLLSLLLVIRRRRG